MEGLEKRCNSLVLASTQGSVKVPQGKGKNRAPGKVPQGSTPQSAELWNIWVQNRRE